MAVNIDCFMLIKLLHCIVYGLSTHKPITVLIIYDLKEIQSSAYRHAPVCDHSFFQPQKFNPFKMPLI